MINILYYDAKIFQKARIHDFASRLRNRWPPLNSHLILGINILKIFYKIINLFMNEKPEIESG